MESDTSFRTKSRRSTRPRIRFVRTRNLLLWIEMRLIRWLVIICGIVLLAYGASPYVSLSRFTRAVQARDAAAGTFPPRR